MKAIHIYSKLGFEIEGELKQEFFINGEYRTVIRMCIFQPQYLAKYKTPSIKMLNTLGSDGPNCFFPVISVIHQATCALAMRNQPHH